MSADIFLILKIQFHQLPIRGFFTWTTNLIDCLSAVRAFVVLLIARISLYLCVFSSDN
uniref:Uncharacterized protein n=1 Tax=Rhizophora mucronata TaxID=61149 RepID=A0A2P2IJD6_RHIMU